MGTTTGAILGAAELGAVAGGGIGGIVAGIDGRPILPGVGLGAAAGGLTGGFAGVGAGLGGLAGGALGGTAGGILGAAGGGALGAEATGGDPGMAALTSGLTAGALSGIGALAGSGPGVGVGETGVGESFGLPPEYAPSPITPDAAGPGGITPQSGGSAAYQLGVTPLAGPDAAAFGQQVAASQLGVNNAGFSAPAPGGDLPLPPGYVSPPGGGSGYDTAVPQQYSPSVMGRSPGGGSTMTGGDPVPGTGGLFQPGDAAAIAQAGGNPFDGAEGMAVVRAQPGVSQSSAAAQALGAPPLTVASAKPDGGIWSSPWAKGAGVALAGGGLINSFASKNSIPGLDQIRNLAQSSATQGAVLQSYLTTGTLPPAIQASVDAATRDAVTQVKASYSGRGMAPGSSAEIADVNRIRQNAVVQGATLADQLLARGISQSTLAGELYQRLVNANTSLNSQTGSAIGNLASALAGGGTRITVGGG